MGNGLNVNDKSAEKFIQLYDLKGSTFAREEKPSKATEEEGFKGILKD